MQRILVTLVLLLASLSARADPADDRRSARAHYRQGQAYQAAGAYEQAIVEFKAAHQLTPLPALLFNLGQAYRLKGDKHAALEHYRRFLEAQPDGRGSDEARTHVALLTAAIAEEEDAIRKTRETAPPAPEPTPVPTPVVSPPVVEVAAPAPPPSRVPIYKRWWLWTAIGGVAVVGLAVGLGVGLTRTPHYPTSPAVMDGLVRW